MNHELQIMISRGEISFRSTANRESEETRFVKVSFKSVGRLEIRAYKVKDESWRLQE